MSSRLVALDCACFTHPTANTIGLLARCWLTARRQGCACRLTNASNSLIELIELVGLAEALGVEAQRQTEEREELRRVEEKGELGDPAV
jgi:ABC-type transporter Mla MlaB component